MAIAGAKLYFMVTGLVQQFALARVLGIEGYGALRSALSIASIAYNPITSTGIQGVSRAVAGTEPAQQPTTIRRVLIIHSAVGVLASAAFFAAAPFVGRAVGAPHVVNALRILSGVLLLYGLYTPLVGVMNGRRQFVRQAGIDVFAATLRTGGLIGGAWWFSKELGLGVEGASTGFVSAVILVLAVALLLSSLGRPGVPKQSVWQHLGFITPLLLGQVVLNLLLQADSVLLRRFAADAAAAAGKPMTAADALVGAYASTQLFAFLPYQLLLSVTFVLFPMLASAQAAGDGAAVAGYVKTGIRVALIVAGLMVSVTSGLSAPLLRLVFPPEAERLGATSMQLLTIGLGGFAIFGILTTVLNSLKRERESATITAAAFGFVVVSCWLFVRGAPFDSGLLLRTAASTSAGLALATLLAAWMVKRTAGAVVSPLTLFRVLAALSGAIAVARTLPQPGKPVTLLYIALIGAVYGALLVLMREVRRADFDLVRTVLSRKRRLG
ncbi:MAG TPA: oligosaccharide flippase family protein [Polyangiaceae bacterium]